MMPLIEQDNYEVAYNEAAEILAESNLEERCGKSGLRFVVEEDSEQAILTFLNDEIVIKHPNISLSYLNKEGDIPLWLQILILHYIIYAKGTPLTGEQISFKQLEGGLAYYPAFRKRTVVPLLNVFGSNLEDFVNAGIMIGGIRDSYGDYSLTFYVFPRISISFVFWRGDKEFPPEGSMIFDSSITDYLTTEDVAVLCNMIAVMMIKRGAVR